MKIKDRVRESLQRVKGVSNSRVVQFTLIVIIGLAVFFDLVVAILKVSILIILAFVLFMYAENKYEQYYGIKKIPYSHCTSIHRF